MGSERSKYAAESTAVSREDIGCWDTEVFAGVQAHLDRDWSTTLQVKMLRARPEHRQEMEKQDEHSNVCAFAMYNSG